MADRQTKNIYLITILESVKNDGKVQDKINLNFLMFE